MVQNIIYRYFKTLFQVLAATLILAASTWILGVAIGRNQMWIYALGIFLLTAAVNGPKIVFFFRVMSECRKKAPQRKAPASGETAAPKPTDKEKGKEPQQTFVPASAAQGAVARAKPDAKASAAKAQVPSVPASGGQGVAALLDAAQPLQREAKP